MPVEVGIYRVKAEASIAAKRNLQILKIRLLYDGGPDIVHIFCIWCVFGICHLVPSLPFSYSIPQKIRIVNKMQKKFMKKVCAKANRIL